VPLTLGDLAAYLNRDTVPTGPDAVEVQRFLDAAVQGVTRRTGLLDGTTVTAAVTMGWEVALLLPYRRLAAIGPVTDPYGNVVTPYHTDPLAGIVELIVPTLGVWTVQCTGSPWPAELSLAALEWASHLYQTQRAAMRPTDDDTPLPSYAVPNRVAELLHPYRAPGIA
jgi:hypothetical protein